MDRQILVLNDCVIFKTNKMEAWITENHLTVVANTFNSCT